MLQLRGLACNCYKGALYTIAKPILTIAELSFSNGRPKNVTLYNVLDNDKLICLDHKRKETSDFEDNLHEFHSICLQSVDDKHRHKNDTYPEDHLI